MGVNFLLEFAKNNLTKEAIIWKNKAYTYKWLTGACEFWTGKLSSEKIAPGKVVVIDSDFTPNAIALFLSLMAHACIIVPLTNLVPAKKAELCEVAQAEFLFRIDNSDNVKIIPLPYKADHELYSELVNKKSPGLVLFSSGSTGKNKGAVHNLSHLVEKFRTPRNALRTIPFLLYDHIGGINTMFYAISNAGCLVIVEDRKPDTVLSAIEKHNVELLPTSPTFLNLILLSEAYKRYRLDSLKLVTYGTEPMPESTLARYHKLFPNLRLLQTYGLSETGIFRSKSKSSDSLWLKIDGDGMDMRIVDGLLHVKSSSAMLGYLNAPSPFTDDGWLNTEDAVEVDGEYIKILGRKSEIINVGGEKVYPNEVESVVQSMDNVSEVTVYGEKNAILGNIVCATVRLQKKEDQKAFTAQLKKYCRKRLQKYKVPVKIKIVDESLHNQRFKKIRLLNIKPQI